MSSSPSSSETSSASSWEDFAPRPWPVSSWAMRPGFAAPSRTLDALFRHRRLRELHDDEVHPLLRWFHEGIWPEPWAPPLFFNRRHLVAADGRRVEWRDLDDDDMADFENPEYAAVFRRLGSGIFSSRNLFVRPSTEWDNLIELGQLDEDALSVRLELLKTAVDLDGHALPFMRLTGFHASQMDDLVLLLIQMSGRGEITYALGVTNAALGRMSWVKTMDDYIEGGVACGHQTFLGPILCGFVMLELEIARPIVYMLGTSTGQLLHQEELDQSCAACRVVVGNYAVVVLAVHVYRASTPVNRVWRNATRSDLLAYYFCFDDFGELDTSEVFYLGRLDCSLDAKVETLASGYRFQHKFIDTASLLDDQWLVGSYEDHFDVIDLHRALSKYTWRGRKSVTVPHRRSFDRYGGSVPNETGNLWIRFARGRTVLWTLREELGPESSVHHDRGLSAKEEEWEEEKSKMRRKNFVVRPCSVRLQNLRLQWEEKKSKMRRGSNAVVRPCCVRLRNLRLDV